MSRRRALAWGIVAVVAAAVLYWSIRLTRDLTDFAVYRTAGARLLAAEPLYRADDGHFVFKYLPAFAFAVTPFAVIGAETAKAAWFALSFALTVAFVAGAIALLPGRRLSLATLAAVTLVVTARLDVRELSLGQTNVLLGAILVGALAASTRGRSAVAGALVGGATFVKPYTVLLAAWLAATAGVPALVACAATVLGGLALPAAVYGWTGNLTLLGDWFRTVTETTAPNLLLPENVSFVSAWAKWLGAGPVATLLATATGVAAIGCAVVVFARRAWSDAPAYLEFALLLLLVPLLTPQGWDYMLLLGTPALVCVIDRFSRLSAGWRAGVAAACVAIGVPWREVAGLDAARAVGNAAVLTVAAGVLVGALVRLRLTRAA